MKKKLLKKWVPIFESGLNGPPANQIFYNSGNIMQKVTNIKKTIWKCQKLTSDANLKKSFTIFVY